MSASGARADDDIWFMPLSDKVDPVVVETFLQGRVREHEHLDYRAKIDPGGDIPGARNRLAETVAAMANTGGVGVIFIGVSEDGSGDRPDKAWLLKPGDLREQTIEAKCHQLEPYVPVEIGRAVLNKGEVVIVRVPDFQERPVFLRDQGILVRRGQSNVPASPAEIQGWLARPAGVYSNHPPSDGYNFLDLVGKSSPALNLGVAPGRGWPYRRWGDETDDSLTRTARQLYPPLGALHVGEGVIRFGEEPTGDQGSLFTVSSSGVVFRASRPSPIPYPLVAEGPCNLIEVGVDLARMWAFARLALPVILPKFPGPATLSLSIGGVSHGFGLVPTQETARILHDVERSPLADRDNWRGQWSDLQLGSPPADVAVMILSEMLRAFGYRGTRPWLALVRQYCETLPEVTSQQ